MYEAINKTFSFLTNTSYAALLNLFYMWWVPEKRLAGGLAWAKNYYMVERFYYL